MKNVTAREKAKRRRMALIKQEWHRSVLEANRVPVEESPEIMRRTKGFLIIPDEFTYCGKHLSYGARLTWLAIFSHSWEKDPTKRVCWAGWERLAVIVGCSCSQLSVYLEELREHKILISKRRLGKSSLRVLNDPPASWMEETKRALKRNCPPPHRPQPLGRGLSSSDGNELSRDDDFSSTGGIMRKKIQA